MVVLFEGRPKTAASRAPESLPLRGGSVNVGRCVEPAVRPSSFQARVGTTAPFSLTPDLDHPRLRYPHRSVSLFQALYSNATQAFTRNAISVALCGELAACDVDGCTSDEARHRRDEKGYDMRHLFGRPKAADRNPAESGAVDQGLRWPT